MEKKSEITGEHELKESMTVDMFYINEPEPRKATPVFEHMKRTADKAGTRCAITGQPHPQYHHFFCEYAARDEIDWHVVKGVALGTITELPVLDLDNHEPTGETYPAEASLIWRLCRFAEIFGMDWKSFDPDDPVSFVDSIHNMLPLHEKFHIAKNSGIHLAPFPMWILWAMPLKKNFHLTKG